MKKRTNTVINWLVQYNVINETEKELYQYGLYSLLLLILPFILASGIGFCLGSMKHGIMLILPFLVIRKFSGGYHAKYLRYCILGSCILLFLSITLSIHMKYDWKLGICTGIAAVSLIVFSPIDSENRRLDIDEKRRYKKITAFCVILFGLLNIFSFFLEKHIYTTCFSIGIILTAGLQVPCIAKKYIN
ncbi:MAG: accessory gene regulator B family protein [Blautia hansenii]|nr:accessory gene regulator B family protein [Blautia hansenii]MEE0656991.1 accessory gene regulator B family protein [Blautia hansenii]